MDEELADRVIGTIFEAGHHDALLEVLRGAADELGKPEVWEHACEALGFKPRR